MSECVECVCERVSLCGLLPSPIPCRLVFYDKKRKCLNDEVGETFIAAFLGSICLSATSMQH